MDHYLESSVVAYRTEYPEEVIAAEEGGLTKGERALLDLLNEELRRDLSRTA